MNCSSKAQNVLIHASFLGNNAMWCIAWRRDLCQIYSFCDSNKVLVWLHMANEMHKDVDLAHVSNIISNAKLIRVLQCASLYHLL